LEKGYVHVPNFKSFLFAEAENKHVSRRARFQQHRDARSHKVFFSARQEAEANLDQSNKNITGICAISFHRQKLGGPV
jgi:hypothetical protein